LARNPDIVADVERVVAFWDGASRGTRHIIELARRADKLFRVYIRRGDELLIEEGNLAHSHEQSPRVLPPAAR
jgi:hypothetical protein